MSIARVSLLALLLVVACAPRTPTEHAPAAARTTASDAPARARAGQPIPPLPKQAALVTTSGIGAEVRGHELGLGTMTVPRTVETPTQSARVPLPSGRADIAVTISGRLARTEVTQVFVNDGDRPTEGSYAFTLPTGAALTRLAMDVDGAMVEGELVERERARRVYDGIVHAQKDPALLEWQGGNRFTMNVFPIPAHGTKTVIVAYQERLASHEDDLVYRYALPRDTASDAGPIGAFEFALDARDADPIVPDPSDRLHVVASARGGHASFTAQKYRPEGAIEVRMRGTGTTTTRALVGRHDDADYFQVEWSPERQATPDLPERALVVALDTSAGIGTSQLERAKAAARALLAQPDSVLVYGDMSAAVCPAHDCLDALDAGGGSDLGALLDLAITRAGALGRPAAVVLLSDGVASLGELDVDALEALIVKRLDDAGDVTLSAIAVGPSADLTTLGALTSRGALVQLLPERDPAQLAAALQAAMRTPRLSDVHVTVVAGEVSDLTPTTIASVGLDDIVPISGRIVSRGRAPVTLEIRARLAGEPVVARVDIDAADAPDDAPAANNALVHDFWARAVIDERERRGDARADVVAFSKAHGVMSKYTSFLVLENERMYAEHGIARTQGDEPRANEPLRMTDDRLSDLLTTVDAANAAPQMNAGVELMSARLAVAMGDDASEFVVGAGSGGMGFLGTGEGGGGDGVGRIQGMYDYDIGGGGGARNAVHANVTFGTLELSGGCDAYEVRLRLRRRAGIFRACLDQRLREVPNLSGRLPLRWVIDAHGAVQSGVVDRGATLVDALMQACALRALRRVHFDAPTSGVCVAKQPLTFSLGDAEVAEADVPDEETMARDFDRGDLDDDAIGRWTTQAIAHGHGAAVADKMLARCALPEARLDQCRTWLAPLVALDGVRPRLDALTSRRIDSLRAQRRDDFGNPELIFELAALLAPEHPHEAARLASEMVELAPYDHAARVRYAGWLLAQGDDGVAPACDQYRAAAQTNPAERDTFRTMMSMRRAHPAQADAITRCIVDGVAGLPVRRDLSIVMTWDDASADVDLHVTAPSGNEVWYQQRESEDGGLLYYDVTDGFGPEIYTLGQADAGAYRLDVIYFNGTATAVSGKLTIIRRAGHADETREERPFTLHGVNTDRKLSLGTISVLP